MTVAGIDSAELSGIAVVARDRPGRERLVLSGVRRIRTAADVAAVVAELAAQAPDVVAIEEPFIHPRQPLAGLVLARLLGRWLQAFEGQGITCVTTPASLWQPAMLAGLMGPQALRAERKAAAQAWCRVTFGVVATEDQADAIAMATYVLRSARWKAAA
jgi:hypothetical protein